MWLSYFSKFYFHIFFLFWQDGVNGAGGLPAAFPVRQEYNNAPGIVAGIDVPALTWNNVTVIYSGMSTDRKFIYSLGCFKFTFSYFLFVRSIQQLF